MSPFLGVLAITAMCYSIHAEDNPAQAAARMALAKELFDSNSQPATNAPSATPAAPAANSQDAKSNAKADKAAKAAAKAKQQSPDAAAAAKAQQEAEKKQAAEARAAAAKAQADREAAAQAQAQMQAKPAQKAVVSRQPEAAPAGANGDNPAQAAARIALAKQLFEMNAPQNGAQNEVEIKQIPPTQAESKETATKNAGETKATSTAVAVKPAPAPAPAPRAPAPVVASKPMPGSENNYVGKELGLKQIPAPALPINGSKAARLQDLLEKYKSDQISPEEYHRQRAAILSEP